MIINCRNTLSGLTPLYDSDFNEKRKLKLNSDYKVEIKLIRNSKFHRKFFALLNVGYKHSPTLGHLPFNIYREEVTILAGFFEIYETERGVIKKAKSIAFNKMSEEQFQELYDKVLDVIVQNLGCTTEELENEIRSFF